MLIVLLSACTAASDETSDGLSLVSLPKIVESDSPKDAVDTHVQDVQSPPPVNEYTINMSVDPETRIITGIERVRFTNTTGETFDNICFNLYLNAFSRSTDEQPYFDRFEEKLYENGKDYSSMYIKNVSFDNTDAEFKVEKTVLTVFLAEELESGQSAEIVLQFEAYIPKINNNFGANDYAMWLGNVMPTLAVYDKNGFNNPDYYPAGDPFFSEIANYNVTVTTPKGYVVAGTGSDTVTETEDKMITTFSAQLVRDFVCAVSNSYKQMAYTGSSGVEITMYYYSDVKNVQTFLEVADRSIRYFSGTIGDYPYKKLDIIECGLPFQSGMEYPQAVLMDSAYLQNDRAIVSLAHEVCHQWFYNIIGNDQIREAWIDEGLAAMLQEYIFSSEDEIYTYMSSQYATLNSYLSTAEHTSLEDDTSVYGSWSEYYNIHYTKAKLMFYSLKLTMGADKFDEFLKTYYSKYAFKIVYTEDIIETASEVYGSDLESFFGGWFKSGQMPAFPARPKW